MASTKNEIKINKNGITYLGWFLLFLGIIAFIAIISYQTGSSSLSVIGSSFASFDDSQTAEILAEFLMVIFLIIGVYILSYQGGKVKQIKTLNEKGDISSKNSAKYLNSINNGDPEKKKKNKKKSEDSDSDMGDSDSDFDMDDMSDDDDDL